jgi:threonine synthase
VQSTGCAPIVRAYERGERSAELWQDAETIASGLRVPVAIGDYLMLDAIRASGGSAIAVTDEEIRGMTDLVGRAEGLWMAPEGAATAVAARELRREGKLAYDDRVVLFNTGSGMTYPGLQSPDLPHWPQGG